MDAFKRLRLAGFIVLALILFGTSGFHYLEGLNVPDSVFATIGVLTTLGIETTKPLSLAGKIFVHVLALSGVFVIFIVVATTAGHAIEIAASEKSRYMFWRKKMDKSIKVIKDHYIVCGYGRMGQAIAGEFCSRDVPFVVIENNPEQLPRMIAHKVLFIEGDASDDGILLEAGVLRAKGLIAVAPTDADNTFIVLTARGLNEKLFIVTRSIKFADEEKLRHAGADRVVSPYILGGKRMAWAVLRPAVVDFLDSAVYNETLDMEIGQITATAKSQFTNKTLRDSHIREKSGATVIAIKRRDGGVTSTPSPDIEIHEGDILIAVGTVKHLGTLQNMAES